jgi:hypothetical protein
MMNIFQDSASEEKVWTLGHFSIWILLHYFYLSDYVQVKQFMWRVKIDAMNYLEQRLDISETLEIPSFVWQELEFQMRMCKVMDGSVIKIHWQERWKVWWSGL